MLISSRAAEDISSAIGSVLLSSSSDDVVQVVKQACQWLTLAVASATTDVSSLPAELQENLLVNLTGVVTAAPHLTECVCVEWLSRFEILQCSFCQVCCSSF